MQHTNLLVLYFLKTFRTGLIISMLNLLFCLIFICMAQIHCSYDKGLDYFGQQQQQLKAFDFYFLMACRSLSGNKVQPLTIATINPIKDEIFHTFSTHCN